MVKKERGRKERRKKRGREGGREKKGKKETREGGVSDSSAWREENCRTF